MIKTLGKLRIERNFLIFTKDIYGKPTANSILNVERMNFFFLPMLGTKQEGSLLLSLFNILL